MNETIQLIKANKSAIRQRVKDFFELAGHRYRRWNKTNNVGCVTTGITKLDNLFGGLSGGDVIMLTGFSGTCKRSLSIQIAGHVLVILKLPVMIGSTLLSDQKIMNRLIASIAHVNPSRFYSGIFGTDHWPNLTRAAGLVHDCPLYLDIVQEEAGKKIVDYDRIKALAREYNAKLLIIDHLTTSENVGKELEILKSIGTSLDLIVLVIYDLKHSINSNISSFIINLNDFLYAEKSISEEHVDICCFLNRGTPSDWRFSPLDQRPIEFISASNGIATEWLYLVKESNQFLNEPIPTSFRENIYEDDEEDFYLKQKNQEP